MDDCNTAIDSAKKQNEGAHTALSAAQLAHQTAVTQDQKANSKLKDTTHQFEKMSKDLEQKINAGDEEKRETEAELKMNEDTLNEVNHALSLFEDAPGAGSVVSMIEMLRDQTQTNVHNLGDALARLESTDFRQLELDLGKLEEQKDKYHAAVTQAAKELRKTNRFKTCNYF